MRTSQAILCFGLVLGVMSCRASFQDIQKASLLSGEKLGAKDEGNKSANASPEFPILERTKELPPEDSESYGCDGIVVVHEKGRDKNLDGILQPTEVTDISTECKTKGKDPTNPPKPTDPTGGGKDPGQNPGSKCPNQSKDPSGKCDDPGQSGKK